MLGAAADSVIPLDALVAAAYKVLKKQGFRKDGYELIGRYH
jgi:hypothetical protein